MRRLYAPFGLLTKPASIPVSRPAGVLGEQGELILVGDLRAEHPQHPIELLLLLLFVAIPGSDRLPQSP